MTEIRYYIHSRHHDHVVGPFESDDLAIAYAAIVANTPTHQVIGLVSGYSDEEIRWMLADTTTRSRPHADLIRKAQAYLTACHPTGLLAGLSK